MFAAGMRPALLFWTLTCLSLAPASGSPLRFLPDDPQFIVIENASFTGPPRIPLDSAGSSALATRYLELARSAREPRYFGRAESVLRPWLERGDATAELLVLQADILQSRHDFAGARALLDRALALEPNVAKAHLMRATLLLVQGNPAAARADCAWLIGSGQGAVGTVCLAQTLAGTGQLERATAMIELALASGDLVDPHQQAWALTSLADTQARRGDSASALVKLRAAVAAAPNDDSTRSALADQLIAHGKAREALQVLDVPRPSVGLLVRRVLAQRAIAHPGHAITRRRLEELLRLERARGERVHLREETLLALGTGRPAAHTLALAAANFAVQREPIDARLLARAAASNGDFDALDELCHWRAATGFEDRTVDALLQNCPEPTA